MLAFSAVSWKDFAMYCASVFICTDFLVSDLLLSSKTFKSVIVDWLSFFVTHCLFWEKYISSISKYASVTVFHYFLAMSKLSTTILTSFLFSFLISVPSRSVSAADKLLGITDAECFSTALKQHWSFWDAYLECPKYLMFLEKKIFLEKAAF